MQGPAEDRQARQWERRAAPAAPAENSRSFRCLLGEAGASANPLRQIEHHVLSHGGALANPLRVTIEVTTACTRSCGFCAQGPGGLLYERPVRHFPIRRLRSLATELAQLGVVSVTLTGGEPAYHPRFLEVVRRLKEAGLRIELETDGSHLDAGLIREVGRWLDGGDRVMFSLDAATASTHLALRGRADFASTVRRLAAFARLDAPVITRTVVLRANHDEAEDMVALAASSGCIESHFSLPRASGGQLAMAPLSVRAFAALRRRLGGRNRASGGMEVCSAGRTRMHVAASGAAGPCALTVDRSLVTGTVFDQPVARLWQRMRASSPQRAPCTGPGTDHRLTGCSFPDPDSVHGQAQP